MQMFPDCSFFFWFSARGQRSLLVLHVGDGFLFVSAAFRLCGRQTKSEFFVLAHEFVKLFMRFHVTLILFVAFVLKLLSDMSGMVTKGSSTYHKRKISEAHVKVKPS